jgi:NAD(P)-dependent dehydrogenase (short-subunit alcohol dehydrogenase family)
VRRRCRDKGGAATGALIRQRLGAVLVVGVKPTHHGLRPSSRAFGNRRGTAALGNLVQRQEAFARAGMRGGQGQMAQIRYRLVPARRGGSIINISSDMGLVGGPNRTVYCATKHGLEGMTKAMSIDLGPHGIRINTICPTFIETQLARSMLASETIRNWMLSRIKLGSIGQIEDLMGAVVFLASDASALMTGRRLSWMAAGPLIDR